MKDFAKKMTATVEHKRSNKLDRGRVTKAWELLEKVINQVNACGELDHICGGTRLDELRLPSFVAPFIYPPKVSLKPGYLMRDLVCRPDKDPNFVYDEGSVIGAAKDIFDTQKKPTNMKTASEMRGSAAVLNEVDFSICEHTFQKDNQTAFFPVPMIAELEPLLGDWSNTDVESVVTQWLARNFDI